MSYKCASSRFSRFINDFEIRLDLLPGNVEPGRPCADGVLRLGLLQRRRRASAHQDLGDDAAQLLEDRRAAIRLVMFLIAEPADRHQAGCRKVLELALDRAHARARGAHDFIRVEAAVGMAEQEAQYAALRFREKRVGQWGFFRSHFGNDSSHSGFSQVPGSALPTIGKKCATLHASMDPAAPAAPEIARAISREDMAKLPIRRYEGRVRLVGD